MTSFDIEIPCPKCGTIFEIHYGQHDGMGGFFDNCPKGNCWTCGEEVQLDLNFNKYEIKETNNYE
jgi:endogenous inhibitor of DNA gyrase (YacG/DUF329 family)